MSALERAAKQLANDVDDLAAKLERAPVARNNAERIVLEAEAKTALTGAHAALGSLDEAIAAVKALRQKATINGHQVSRTKTGAGR
ncbi:MAG: hypothetical protein AAFR20_04295 [Pseudomonadota bacterium]